MTIKPFSPKLRRGAWLVSALLLAGLAQPARSASSVVYSTDFQGAVGSEWSPTTTDVTPTGARRFLGQFGNSTVTLSLTGLPAHTNLSLDFDVYAIQSWDGNETNGNGGEIFDLSVDGGPALMHTNFSNSSPGQAFPGNLGVNNSPRTGAVEANSLGYSFGGDAVYRVHRTFAHTGSTATVTFNVSGLEALSNESWGLDNFSVSIPSSVVTTGLSLDHWWAGEGNANDAIGDLTGTLKNGVAFAPGKVGQAFSMDGVNDYVLFPYNSGYDFAPTAQYTLDAWFKPAAINRWHAIICKSPPSGEWNYGLWLTNDNRFYTGNHVSASLYSGTRAQVGQWYHVAVTYNNGSWKLYVNGQVESVLTGAMGSQSTGALAIGRKGEEPTNLGDPGYLQGLVDEVDIHSRALTDAEIAGIYDAGAGGKVLGGKVVFASNRSGNNDIYSMSPDGTGVTQLTNHAANDTFPSFSRDGSKIVFCSERDGNREIYTMNADGTGVARVTTNNSDDVYPAFSPDGGKITFVSNRGSDYALFVINSDGTGEVKIVDSTYGDYVPTWSPDGSKIAFYTFNGSQQADIYTVNPDGSNQVQLTTASGHDRDPHWSPDASRIAFTSQRDGNDEIYVMNADGTNQTRVTNNAGLDALPKFDPTSARLVFNSNRDGNNEIYRVNRDGTGVRRLTTNSANEESPTWSTFDGAAVTPVATIADLSIPEGNTGVTNAVFTVTLASAPLQPATVSYATADGTALAGTDYTATAGTLTFNVGQKSKTITVPVASNTLSNNNRTFTVTLTNPTGAVIGDGTAIGTIVDDDPFPTLSLDNPTVTEGNSGTIPMTFTATLSEASGRTVTASYSAQSGSATSGTDFQAASGTLTFAPGETVKTITVNIIGDTIDENDENFRIVLSNVTNAVHTQDTQFYPINNHYYELVTASLNFNAAKAAAEARVMAGVNGHLATITSAGEMNFVRPLVTSAWIGAYQPAGSSEPAGGWRWVTDEPFSYTNWNPGEPNNANNAEEATEMGSAGSWNDIGIGSVRGSYLVEYDFTSPPPGVAAPQGLGTITADVDPVPAASIANTSVTEGNSGAISCNFTVSLSVVSGKTISLTYTPSDLTATGGDFNGTSGTLTIQPGSATGTVSIPVTGDTQPETDETFRVTLSAPVNATIASAQAVATIINDDAGGTPGANGLTPADGRIVYTFSDIGGMRIRVMNADGSDQHELGAPGWCREAAITADGSKLVYVSNSDGAFDVHMINIDGTNRHRVTTGGGVQPSVSRDGSLVCFIRGQAVYVINADGTNERVVASGVGVVEQPDFSPDATKLIFNSNRDGLTQLYRINIDGSGLLRLTDLTANDGNASYSPDGSRIAFQSSRTGGNDIYLMNADGSNLQRLTTDPAHDGAPWFSPDGAMLAFESERTGSQNWGIYTMNLNGTNQVRLTGANYSAIPAWGGAVSVPGAGFVVNTTADIVDGADAFLSLREAITAANAAPGSTIRFNIPQTDSGFSGGVWTIRPTSALPALTAAGTVLNAATQTTNQGNTNTSGPEIYLAGDNAGLSNGLQITGANIAVRSLAIGNFAAAGIKISGGAATGNVVQTCNIGLNALGVSSPNAAGVWLAAGASGNIIGGNTGAGANYIAGNSGNGILVDAASANLISGNSIGLNAAGTVVPNDANGIVLQNGAAGNSIGGIGSGFGNTISGNTQWGLAIAAANNNTVTGNKFGTNATGAAGAANGFGGIYIDAAAGTQIGNALGSARNVISGNAGNGIYLYGAPNTTIRNNYIGVTASGSSALGNGGSGVWADGGSSNVIIGSTLAGERNVIADNYAGGVNISASNGATVTGNYIGVGANGSTALGNGSLDFPGGVLITDAATGSTIGGTASGAGNVIANNYGAGIAVRDTASANTLRGNSIHSNTALGIDLKSSGEDAAGVTPNDAGDGDSGPNGLQNYPVFTSIISANGATVIQGSLNSTPGATFAVDIYTNTTGDASGYGEGQSFLTTTSVTTDGNGDAAINLTLATSSLIGKAFSATATDAGGNTSEFGPVFVALADTVAPVAAITSPTEGASGETAPPVTGTASDTGGTGVGSVTVALRRAAANGAPEAYYNWNNGALDVTYNQGAHEKTASGTASWSLTLPSTLPGGSYQLRATAIDLGGNRGNSDWVGFTLTDETAPTASITSPANLALSNSFTTATGTASDSGVRPSGVAKVTLSLKLEADGGTPESYWAGGTTWTPTYDAGTNEIVATGTTSWSLALPTLVAGDYTLTAHATDVAGNVSNAAATVTFTVELTPPTVAITTPANGGIYGTLATGTGTVADDSGVMKVTGRLYRAANGAVPAGYWAGGSTWTTTYSAANEKQATGISNWSLTLPTLPDGNYNFRATATDVAGNVAVSTVNSFRIDKTTLVVAVTAPAPDNVKVKAAPSITGTAANNVTQVTCWFFRYANGGTPAGYWAGGSTWTPTYSAANERACTGTANWSLALPALVEGNYSFRATATDVFGKKTSTQFMHFTVDTTAPTLTVTAPLPENVKLTVMPTAVTGTAGDTVSGIARVTGWFFRYANGGTPAGYWAGGNTWTASYTAVNDIVCTGTTSWSLGLPTLPDGSYAFRMTATDGAGNQLTKPIGHFSLDTVAPLVNITAPAANGAYKSITSATGTASDSGAGVTRVTGRLFREANGPTPAGYWAGGTTWTPTYSATNERLCTGTTNWSLALPALPDGSYSFRATATDGAGNTTASAVHSFMVDNVAPALVITQPATEGGSYSSVPALTGTSSDGGSGVNRVTAWLYRYVNGGTPAGYWASGSTWTAGVNELVCTGTTAWSLTTPTLPAGNYAFRVTVFDNAGNSLQSAFRHFTITPAGSPGIGPSGAGASGLSTASAKATTNSVTLVFNNSLDAASAADASHYAVTINGTSATVTGVAYAASSRSVVLTLESGALHAGDQVVAVWNGVLGASGTSYSGQTGSLTAK